MLATERGGGNGCEPSPDFGPGEDLLTTNPVAVPQEGDGATGDKLGDIAVGAGDEKVKDSHISLTTR